MNWGHLLIEAGAARLDCFLSLSASSVSLELAPSSALAPEAEPLGTADALQPVQRLLVVAAVVSDGPGRATPTTRYGAPLTGARQIAITRITAAVRAARDPNVPHAA